MALTDPAREFADTCTKLAAPAKEKGEQVLAERFGVQPWSTDFIKILFILSRRGDELIDIIANIGLDEDLRSTAVNHVRRIQMALSPAGLQPVWENTVKSFLSSEHIGPIYMLSPSVRPTISYPKLESNEVKELSDVVNELLTWLMEHQLHEQDFIRQALIDGLEQFLFRMDRMEWLGWGYTLQSLRDVIGAYMALERSFPDSQAAPTAKVMLGKTLDVLKVIVDKIGIVKDFYDKGDFLIKAYGVVMLLSHGPQQIAGLLTFASS